MTFASPRLLAGNVLSRLFATLGLLAALLTPGMAAAADWDIDRLMQSLANARPGKAAFVEKKTMAMLDRPLESSGELHYIAPDRLEKRTIRPKPETMVVVGDTLTIERGQRRHTVQLHEYPELAAFINSIRGTLAGDRQVLERSFRLKLEGSAGQWLLQLTPADAAIGRTVHLIRITGARDMLRTIEVIHTDGDRSLMTIEPVPAQ
jgi:hypothetical protein